MVSTRILYGRMTTVLLAIVMCSLESTIADQECQDKIREMVEQRCSGGGKRARRNIPSVLPSVEPDAEPMSEWQDHNLVRKQLGSPDTGAKASTADSQTITRGILSSPRSYESPIFRRLARSPYKDPETDSSRANGDDLAIGLSHDDVYRFYDIASVRMSRSSGRNPSETKNAIISAATKCCINKDYCDEVLTMIPCQ